MISDTERAELANQGWKADPDRDAISKAFKFRNFVEAFGFGLLFHKAGTRNDHGRYGRRNYLTVHDRCCGPQIFDAASNITTHIAQSDQAHAMR